MSFNEARANCAGNFVGIFLDPPYRTASMRPAQIAREIMASAHNCVRSRSSFNEARANCAGNFVEGWQRKPATALQ